MRVCLTPGQNQQKDRPPPPTPKLLLRLAVNSQMASKVLCTTSPGLRQTDGVIIRVISAAAGDATQVKPRLEEKGSKKTKTRRLV